MSHRRMKRTRIAFAQRSWRQIALVAGAILVGSVSTAPPASATLVGEAVDLAGTTVESVHVTPSPTPSLPSVAPPATSPPPVATPAAPQAPVRLPTEATPTPSSPPPSPGVNLPSTSGIARTTRNSIDSVTSAGKEAPRHAAAPARNDGNQASSPQTTPVPAQARPPARTGTASSGAPSITAAEVAALQRWFARIWPAIPLGGDETGQGWATGVMEKVLFRPAVAATARSLFPAAPIARDASDSPSAAHSETANGPSLSLSNASAGGEKIIYLVAIAALLALLAFTIWREFRAALRPGVR